jgi:hypothetical protein
VITVVSYPNDHGGVVGGGVGDLVFVVAVVVAVKFRRFHHLQYYYWQRMRNPLCASVVFAADVDEIDTLLHDACVVRVVVVVKCFAVVAAATMTTLDCSWS